MIQSQRIGSLVAPLALGLAFLTVAVTGADAQARPPASECLAMAQGLPGARYARFEENAPTQNTLPLVRVNATAEVSITYAGHSTYVIDTPGGVRIATDFSGYYRTPGRLPDVVTMNRAHSSHYTLNPDRGIKHVLHGWADNGAAKHYLTLDDVLIRNVTTDIRFGFSFNNGGAPMQLDANSIFIFEVAGLCIGHLGHLHHRLTDMHIAEIGRIDILMVPVDGGLTMSLDGMTELTKRLRSSVVMPMHRNGTSMEEFLSPLRGQFQIERRSGRTYTVSRETLPKVPTIVIVDGV